MNKTMYIPASRSTGPGPAHFQSQLHEQNHAHPSLQIHWPRTCSIPITWHEQNNTDPCFQGSCPGSRHFQLHVMNKQYESKHPKLPAWIWSFPITGHEQINTDRSHQIHWPWTCSFPITTSWTKQYTTQRPDPLALDLLTSNHNLMNKTIQIHASRVHALDRSFPITWHEQNNTSPSFPSSWLRSCHFQSHVMNKTMQIYASTSTGLESAHFPPHVMNKTMQIQASRSTGPGPSHFQLHFINKQYKS